ncbi:MAG: histidine kinase [Bacteroidota bacterium]
MAQRFSKQITDRIYSFFSHRIVYHILFWICYILFFTALRGAQSGYFLIFTNELINSFFFGLVVYFNIYYLIPNYLSQTKFASYSILLLLTVTLVTPLNVFALYLKFFSNPEYQSQVVASQLYQFILTFIIAGLSTILKIITDWVRHQRVRRELEKQTMRSELKFLKSQINPHFLFNTLNNLYALTLKKSDKAPEIVLKLSEMMRYMLYECNEKRVPLSKEVNYLKNYLDLERLRQGKNVEIGFSVNGQVSDQKIAPLMFIPFLENSFKHGLSNQISKGFVHFKLDVDHKNISMSIENSKPAMPHNNHRSGGIGLNNVRRRLDLLYPDHYRLDINDTPNVYTVNLKIDLD